MDKIDKYKILKYFIVVVLIIGLVVILSEQVQRLEEQERQRIESERDTSNRDVAMAERISKDYMKIINIGGKADMQRMSTEYKTKMTPRMYKEVFGGISNGYYSQEYKEYKVEEVLSTQSQDGGNSIIDVRMVVKFKHNRGLYHVRFMNGLMDSIEYLGVRREI